MAHLIQPLDKIYEAGKACCDALLKRTAYELNPSGEAEPFVGYLNASDDGGIAKFRSNFETADYVDLVGYVGFGVCCGITTTIEVDLFTADSDTLDQIDCWTAKVYKDSGNGLWVEVLTHDACNGDDFNGFTYLDLQSPDACGFRYKVEFFFIWIGGSPPPQITPTLAGFDVTVTVG